MGHELVHVGQFAALAGQPYSLLEDLVFMEMLDYHAYSWQHRAGGLSLNNFTTEEKVFWSMKFQDLFYKTHYLNFPMVAFHV